MPVLLFAFATFIAMLVGLPPFPGFYAKWDLAHALVAADRLPVLVLILVGALIEAGYLFRWFGYALKRDYADACSSSPTRPRARHLRRPGRGLGPRLRLGGAQRQRQPADRRCRSCSRLLFIPLDPVLPARIKNVLAIAGLVAWFFIRMPVYDPMQMIFAIIMLLGGAVIFLASFAEDGSRIGFYPSAMLMYAGLALLIEAKTTFGFFAAWEVLTIGSYFLILRGKLSEPHALSYILFSLGGAFALLFGFALAAGGVQPFALDGLQDVPADAGALGLRPARRRLHDQDRLDGLPHLAARRPCRGRDRRLADGLGHPARRRACSASSCC